MGSLENAEQQKRSCYTDPQYAKSEMMSPTWFRSTGFDKLRRCQDMGLFHKKQTQQLDSDITGHVFTFPLHEILIYP